MTETLSAPPAVQVTDRTIGFRRRAGAIALPLAFACQVVANSFYAIASTGNAGDSGTGDQTLQFYAEHADLLLPATVFALAGSLLAVPGLLAALRLLRRTRPTLGLWAVMLMITGYLCYFGLNMTGFTTLALAELGVDAGPAMDAAQSHPAALSFALLFVVGNLLGTLLLGLAVILSRDLPWWAGALIIGWPVGHVINLAGAGEWLAVAGGALEVAGLCVLMARALRTSDTVWATRG